ncbi:MAG: binding-protein-dependent transport system inner rane component [Gemmatimonadetes bacterium]|nr:binding-protein-dependent transport system inner rane component [Gemmatimonadota bacterium]
MARHLVVRALIGVGVMWGVVTLVFLLLRAAPGDPARLLLGPAATQTQIDEQRHQLGLDRPVAAQYGAWISRVVRGDLGTSIATGRPVRTMLAEAWPATALLVTLSLLLSYVLGILLALVQANVSGSRTDTSLSVASVTLYAMPSYWLAVVLVLVFAYWLRVFPAFGATGLDAEFLTPVGRVADRVRHLALPLLTLTLIGMGGIARYVRGALVDLQGSQFLVVARAKGLSKESVLLRHALPNALIPVLILLGLSLPALFSGAVFVEAIFAWPGVGRLLVAAVQARDYPVVLAATTISAGLVVLGSLVADGLVVLADPRLRDTAHG